MNHRFVPVALFGALALAACATDDVIAPDKAIAAPSFAVSATQAGGSYLVAMKGNGIPKDFAARVAALGGTVTFAHGPTGFAVVDGLSDAAALQLGRGTDVAEVQADAAIHLSTPLSNASVFGQPLAMDEIASPNFPQNAAGVRAGYQWNLKLIKADAAWTATPKRLGSPTVRVAIIDSGIDYDGLDMAGHVDLVKSVSFMNKWVGPDDEKPGLSDDAIVGGDLIQKRFPKRLLFTDLNDHGTNVASQVSSNAFLFAGVTSKTTLVAVKVVGANGAGSFGTVLSGVLYAADPAKGNADIANMSLGGDFAKAGAGRFVSIINRVFNYAAQQGMLIVVAAGNDGADMQHNANTYDTYCDSPHVICVSSVGPVTSLINPDEPAFYSNFGRNSLTVAAPGGSADVSSGDGSKEHPFPTSPRPWGNDFASWIFHTCSQTLFAHDKDGNEILPCAAGPTVNGFIGTSQAAPHVAGLAALLIAEKGKVPPQTIKLMIERSADRVIDPAYGRGRINVKAALGL